MLMAGSAEQEVRDTIDRFSEAVKNRNIDEVAKIVAHEKDIVFYGSQAGDKTVGWPAIKASFEEQFAEAEEIDSEILDTHVYVAGEMAWTAYDLRYKEVGGSGAATFESRWTGVFRRYPDGWKCVHMHHSRGR
jgi:ketosteroid isomerase-like protein